MSVAMYWNPQTNKYEEVTGGGMTANSDGVQNNYSSEETVIGTWIDGKPIYRKVIKYSSPTLWNGEVQRPILPNNTETILRGFVTGFRNNEPFRQSYAPIHILSEDTRSSNMVTIYLYWGIYVNNLCIEYTKTTD